MATLFHNYVHEGKGVDKGEYKKKRFFVFFELYFRKWTRLVLLSLLYTVCCVPVVTIGAATAAFMKVLRDMSEEKPIFLLSDFFEAFRKNWKQGTLMFVLDLVVVTVLALVIRYYYLNMNTVDTRWMVVPFVLCCVLAYIYLVMHYYIYLMIVTVDIPFKNMLKNAWLMFFLGFLTNIWTTLGIGVVLAISFWYLPLAVFILPLVGFSTIGFLIAFNHFKYIKKYITDPYYALVAQQTSAQEDENDAQQVFVDRGSEKD